MNLVLSLLTSKLAGPLASGVAVLALLFGVSQCSRADGLERKLDKIEAAKAKAVARNAVAHEAAAVQRQADEADTRRAQEEISRADDATPDSRPSERRRAYLCARLREQADRGGPAVPESCGPRR